MFTCSGTLNSVTIPYSTIAEIPWDDILSLDLAVWRRQREGGYSQEGGDIEVPDVEISSRVVTTNIKGNVTLESTMNIQKYDILQFIVPPYERRGWRLTRDKREHVPFLLTENQQSCTPPGCPLVPIIRVEFSSSEPVQGRPYKQPDKLQVHTLTYQATNEEWFITSSILYYCSIYHTI